MSQSGSYIWLVTVLMALCLATPAQGQTEKKIRTYAYIVKIPASMNLVSDTLAGKGQIYYDGERDILMAATASESIFKSVDDYLNCSWPELDKNLRQASEDTSFRLLSCNKTGKATILIYTINAAINAYPYCILYFIHHKQFELQFSFYFRKSEPALNERYAADIMRTMRVRRTGGSKLK
jgi:hypothetical protein